MERARLGAAAALSRGLIARGGSAARRGRSFTMGNTVVMRMAIMWIMIAAALLGRPGGRRGGDGGVGNSYCWEEEGKEDLEWFIVFLEK